MMALYAVPWCVLDADCVYAGVSLRKGIASAGQAYLLDLADIGLDIALTLILWGILDRVLLLVERAAPKRGAHGVPA
ncbi:MAG: hypothetical protein V2A79_05880 [Planctomycetota bacterium]